MDALVDLKSESEKTRCENLIPNTSNGQDAPSRRHVGLQQRSLSPVTCHCSSRSDHKRERVFCRKLFRLKCRQVRRVWRSIITFAAPASRPATRIFIRKQTGGVTAGGDRHLKRTASAVLHCVGSLRPLYHWADTGRRSVYSQIRLPVRRQRNSIIGYFNQLSINRKSYYILNHQ